MEKRYWRVLLLLLLLEGMGNLEQMPPPLTSWSSCSGLRPLAMRVSIPESTAFCTHSNLERMPPMERRPVSALAKSRT